MKKKTRKRLFDDAVKSLYKRPRRRRSTTGEGWEPEWFKHLQYAKPGEVHETGSGHVGPDKLATVEMARRLLHVEEGFPFTFVTLRHDMPLCYKNAIADMLAAESMPGIPSDTVLPPWEW